MASGGQLWESGEDDHCFGNDATASSSLAYTRMTVSSFVRRSNSVKRTLEETSLAPLSGSLFCVKRCTRAAKPVLSMWSTSVRLMTTLSLSDNSFSTSWRNAVVSFPATRWPTQRRMITLPQKYVLVLRATDVPLRQKPTQSQS